LGIILEVKSGAFAGRKIPLRDGEGVLIGRAPERAQFAVPHDNKMSGVHFAVECGPAGCRVIDKKSTNGTFLNGARIQEAMQLANGDEIRSGQTIFVVHIVPEGRLSAPASSPVAAPKSAAPPASPTATANAKSSATAAPRADTADVKLPAAAARSALPPSPSSLPAALAIGGWVFPKIPEGWQIQEGIGIQQIVKGAFPASITVTEEPMAAGSTLPQYIEAHTKMFREHLPQPKVDAVAAPVIPGSEETVAVEIRFTIKDGPAVYWRRVYTRSGSTIGVLMLTSLEKDLSAVRPACDSVLTGISFSHKEQA
jgi:predicted component of type VI protein secretion system